MTQIDETPADRLSKLSKEHREVLSTPGSYAEIAAALGIPIGTVKSRLNRARAAVKQMQAEAVS